MGEVKAGRPIKKELTACSHDRAAEWLRRRCRVERMVKECPYAPLITETWPLPHKTVISSLLRFNALRLNDHVEGVFTDDLSCRSHGNIGVASPM